MTNRWVFRSAGAVSFALLACIFLGCMSLSIGGRTITTSTTEAEVASHDADGVLTQQGCVARLTRGDEKEIFYPVPYASPPNLELSCEWASELSGIELIEQKEDRFRIKTSDSVTKPMTWKARGVRRPTVVVPAGPPEVPPPTTTSPPPVPIIETPKN